MSKVLNDSIEIKRIVYDEETIASRILQQTHETVLKVNLSAMVENVRYFRSKLKPETKLTCMVKAFAYGAGSVEVSKALQASGLVDYLAVAVADEASAPSGAVTLTVGVTEGIGMGTVVTATGGTETSGVGVGVGEGGAVSTTTSLTVSSVVTVVVFCPQAASEKTRTRTSRATPARRMKVLMASS